MTFGQKWIYLVAHESFIINLGFFFFGFFHKNRHKDFDPFLCIFCKYYANANFEVWTLNKRIPCAIKIINCVHLRSRLNLKSVS